MLVGELAPTAGDEAGESAEGRPAEARPVEKKVAARMYPGRSFPEPRSAGSGAACWTMDMPGRAAAVVARDPDQCSRAG